MKTKTFNMTYDLIENELNHKIAVGYENESKRAYEILEELQEKIKIKAHSHNQIERKISGTQEVWILLRGKIKFEIIKDFFLLLSPATV